MRHDSTFLIAVVLLAACHAPSPEPAPKPGPNPAQNSGSDSSSNQGAGPATPQPGPTEAEINKDELQPMMEKKNIKVPVNLTPTENDNLKRAVDTSVIARDSAITHIHADVRNGRLIFVPEPSQDASHVAADAPKITLGGRNSRTVAVVATPAAKHLLDQRTQTH